jgi:hypothetical protein
VALASFETAADGIASFSFIKGSDHRYYPREGDRGSTAMLMCR